MKVSGVIPQGREAREKYFSETKEYNKKVIESNKKKDKSQHEYFAKEVAKYAVKRDGVASFGFQDISKERWDNIFNKKENGNEKTQDI